MKYLRMKDMMQVKFKGQLLQRFAPKVQPLLHSLMRSNLRPIAPVRKTNTYIIASHLATHMIIPSRLTPYHLTKATHEFSSPTCITKLGHLTLQSNTISKEDMPLATQDYQLLTTAGHRATLVSKLGHTYRYSHTKVIMTARDSC